MGWSGVAGAGVSAQRAVSREGARLRGPWPVGASRHVNDSSYRAADAPERRKMPDLYAGLAVAQPSQFAPLHGHKKPEVLAPVGGWPQLHAAVENGADAVYFGLQSGFNARRRASNFTYEELPDMMRYLRHRGCKGYVTLNVLAFDEELSQVEEALRVVAAAGVDAVIVQDVGVARLAQRVAPRLRVHASTQMSITSAEGAEFAQSLGAKRVVVGRELSVAEIARVAAKTSCEVECFVHGALCVSYSGQCFSSEAWGGRSANRGQCAQTCRLPYGLVVDGALRDLGDTRYLLSPQDLMAVEHVPELIRAGVTCFKIEGRLKGPEYVALTTQVYRRAVDRAWAEMQGDCSVAPPSPAAAIATVATDDLVSLRQVFARGQDERHDGLTPGFLGGVQHQRLVRGLAPKHRGVLVGHVSAVRAPTRAQPDGSLEVTLCGVALKRGDGICIEGGDPQREQGGVIYDIREVAGAVGRVTVRGGGSVRGQVAGARGDVDAGARGTGPGGVGRAGRGTGRLGGRGAKKDSLRLEQASGAVELGTAGAESAASGEGGLSGGVVRLTLGSQLEWGEVAVGARVWRTRDLALESALRKTYESVAESDRRRMAVTVRVSGTIGEPLRVEVSNEDGVCGEGSTPSALTPADRRPLLPDSVARAIGELGGTPLRLARFDADGLDVAAGLFVPASDIKEARRAAVEAFLAALDQRVDQADVITSEPALPALLRERGVAAASEEAHGVPLDQGQDLTGLTRLNVLCRNPAQAEAALAVPWVEEIVLDFLEVHGLPECVGRVREAGRRVVVACPRVLKPDEERLSQFYLGLKADALLVRSLGMLHTLAGLRASGEQGVPELRGDFSLNAANSLSARDFLSTGIARLTPTHDLNGLQIRDLALSLGAHSDEKLRGSLEAIVHQHLPIFHTEHCVFCRFLSSGNSYKDCGHPCERSTIHLRDSAGKDHLILADQGCRNTVFNAQAQTGTYFLRGWALAGVGWLRVELVDEGPEHVAPLLEGYRAVLKVQSSPGELMQYLQTVPDANGRAHGATEGSLVVREEQGMSDMKPTAASLREAARS